MRGKEGGREGRERREGGRREGGRISLYKLTIQLRDLEMLPAQISDHCDLNRLHVAH